MNCPNCNSLMEGEDCPLTGMAHEAFVVDGVEMRQAFKEYTTPGAHYYCSSCDSEWVWYKEASIRQIDGRDFENSTSPNSLPTPPHHLKNFS